MNANELADELNDACIEFDGDVWCSTFKEASATLRQQDKEIKLLKADVAGWMDTAIGKTPNEGYWLNLFAKKASEK